MGQGCVILREREAYYEGSAHETQRHQKRTSWKISHRETVIESRNESGGKVLSHCMDKEMSCLKKKNSQISATVLLQDTHMKAS